MLEILAATRFAHFAAIALLFGLAVFPFYAFRPPDPALGFGRSIAALISGVLALLGAAANIGGALASAWDVNLLSSVIGDTEFGRVWVARLVLCLIIVALRTRAKAGPDPAIAVLSGVLLASVSLTGHSRSPTGALGVASVAADGLHLLAAGWWIGGLLGLVIAAQRLGHDPAGVLARFSGVGYGAVAIIVLTGVFKAWLLLGHVQALVSTPYGFTLLAKLVLFAGMGAMALSNRLWISPALARVRAADQRLWLDRLRLQAAVELGLGLLVLAAVGLLGAMEPPADAHAQSAARILAPIMASGLA
jgi:putative copper resistance protein D